ncbi:hypothetical protein HYN48_02710 [Flavobacterium magnum]|uniref:Uncharacterized protein n=1 Tax=Flavobacterium magnum TaxID=2162713 RepID=A0A2S0RBL4_9FLAO|nr:hypothetical protein [Flavobacterium magnum]AWA29083.1 hypothetical protein HYN48_02710 [Flavobacterium magnum]
MLKNWLVILAVLCFSGLYSQEVQSPYRNHKILATRDTVRLDSVSINPAFFKLTDRQGRSVDSIYYKVNFSRGFLVFNENAPFINDSVSVRFLKLPDFLTKEYRMYDRSQIVENGLYQVSRDPVKQFVPFEGLNTSGSITRGITVGNNQNATVNSALDLQITGKISDKVSLRASIQDTNIPLQEGGYSQKLDEFDQIFIELFSEKWNIRAGDLFLENRKSKFLNFNKKVQGVAASFDFGAPENKTTVFASAALVRGQYARSSFTGQEGNQGPYKLKGQNGELFILVVSGSERVYVNGILLKRGESNDYVIDYNAGEITFTSLFPITSEMRINIEYQYSDKNYTRFVTYAGASHEQEKWSLSGYLYSENDVKNQPVQQNLSAEQVQALAAAGDNPTQMIVPSAYEDAFSDNKILYRKVLADGTEIFEYSTNPDDVLYNVRFSLVGNNQGNYILKTVTGIGKIYEYRAPLNGILQGNYEPITRLVPPVKLQVATIAGAYHPDEKTAVDFEMALSNNDKNLYSSLDDGDNQGLAGKVNARQRLYSGKWTLDAFANYQLVQKKFQPIERLFTIEFDRDWNLINPLGDQSLVVTGLDFRLAQQGQFTYQFEKLDFTERFSGARQVIKGNINLEKLAVRQEASYLKSDSNDASSEFLRNQTQLRYHFGKDWIGGSLRLEDNQEKLKATNQLSALSQRFTEYGTFIGRGDSTKVFVELGYLHRVNDSLQLGSLRKVNTSHSYYIKSRLLKTDRSDLTLFANYRTLKFEDPTRESEPSLNSRLLYNDRYFNQLVQVTAAYENFSGTIAQQEFSYVEVDAGQGVYTWNDYNGNGVPELEEFEVAQFSDQAKYVRVFLPNQVFLRTHQNKFSASLTLNPLQWQNEKGIRKLLSYFYNQTTFLTERKIENRNGNFDFNPFASADEGELLGLNFNFRNSLFYNRGKQKHSVTYTFLESESKSLLSAGSQYAFIGSHQLQYTHLLGKSWLVNLGTAAGTSSSVSENYAARNYDVGNYKISPKISYLFNKSASWDLFYEFQRKDNRIGGMESLSQQRFGTSFTFAGEKQFTVNGEFSLYQNQFDGDALAPVAYQMLEGLQPGQNTTWRLLLQKNLTQFLDINLSYQGRKSETSKAIHTGSVQLRAYF